MLMYLAGLVLEFVDGGDLLSYILDQEGLAEGQSQDIIYQICSALAVNFFHYLFLNIFNLWFSIAMIAVSLIAT